MTLFISGGEIFIILLFILIFFGADKIPEFTRFMGKGVREFKKATDDIKREFQDSSSGVMNDIRSISNDLTESLTKEIAEPIQKTASETSKTFDEYKDQYNSDYYYDNHNYNYNDRYANEYQNEPSATSSDSLSNVTETSIEHQSEVSEKKEKAPYSQNVIPPEQI